MDLGLRDRVAVVLASSRGLGRAVAREFAAEGARVVIASRDAERLAQTAHEIIDETGADVRHQPCDVTDPAALEKLFWGQAETLGGIDVLITNAGGPPAGTFQDNDDAAWQAAFELNLLSAIRATRLALPHMRKRGGGRIVHNTSVSIRQPIDGLILSNVLRAGVAGLSKSLAAELGPQGILVNVVAPGRIATDRLKELDAGIAERSGQSAEAVRAGFEKLIPLGRYGEPAEFARAVVWLASWANTYVTGQALCIDGGLVKAL